MGSLAMVTMVVIHHTIMVVTGMVVVTARGITMDMEGGTVEAMVDTETDVATLVTPVHPAAEDGSVVVVEAVAVLADPVECMAAVTLPLMMAQTVDAIMPVREGTIPIEKEEMSNL